ncbi:hypothetical protein [uncultured Sphingomonas sp.]|uniref:hypothetical protein n=1 Tax=uncultured Sphingomonas sp. TaxID=158754 RepID=UPI0025E21653|nr:hypothetical protein [uncultured Sphingomonas sp.]
MSRSTFGLPTFIALLSLAGLVLALTGEGWRDGLSWAALSAPLLAVAWAMTARKPR